MNRICGMVVDASLWEARVWAQARSIFPESEVYPRASHSEASTFSLAP